MTDEMDLELNAILHEAFDDEELNETVDDAFVLEALHRFQVNKKQILDLDLGSLEPSEKTARVPKGFRREPGFVYPNAQRGEGSSVERVKRAAHKGTLWLYKTKYDRVVYGLAGLVGIAMGASLGPKRLLGKEFLSRAQLMLLGIGLSGFAIQSGRSGHLNREYRNDLEDLNSSFGLRVINGHHRVHQEEERIVRRAKNEIYVLEQWYRPRTRNNTRPFSALQQALDDRVREGVPLRFAGGVGEENLGQFKEMVSSKLGKPNAEVRFFLENPIQMDVIMTDAEAILSFPRENSDRSFALHFRNPAVVQELREIFETYAWNRDRKSVV